MCYAFYVTEEKRGRGRPKTTGTTPSRHIRIGTLWDEAEAIAKSREDNMSDILRPGIERDLKRYIKLHRTTEG
jgi:hypothetical protein